SAPLEPSPPSTPGAAGWSREDRRPPTLRWSGRPPPPTPGPGSAELGPARTPPRPTRPGGQEEGRPLAQSRHGDGRPNRVSPPRARSPEVDEDVLGLGIEVDRGHPELAPDPGHLVAAER